LFYWGNISVKIQRCIFTLNQFIYRTRSVVAEALQHLNATRVVIAHRLSTVIDTDCIYVVDAGRVVQSGTYEELLNTEGVFQSIAKPQPQLQ
jgi:ABC-type multidrug transport system fused ATPase/permease subunit